MPVEDRPSCVSEQTSVNAQWRRFRRTLPFHTGNVDEMISESPPTTPLETPIINSPYEEPRWHWDLDERGVARAPARPGRRRAMGILPVPSTKGGSAKQGNLYELAGELAVVNDLRDQVGNWRHRGYPGVTDATSKLLRHWNSDQPEPRLFFAQKEAIETLIYMYEIAGDNSQVWSEIDEANHLYNDGITRLAIKMATGAGKTTVMGLVIIWQTANWVANPNDRRFTNQFTIITPGITVRDRNAKDLIPNRNGEDLYRGWRLIPNDRTLKSVINTAKVEVTNFQALQRRELAWGEASGKSKKIARVQPKAETDREMLKRALPHLDAGSRIMVLNDEGHHCHNTDPDMVESTKEERQTADMWFNAIKTIRRTRRLHSVIDFSATPMFITKNPLIGRKTDEIFPWTVSDFPLTDAIEAGMVKIPRVPVADDVRDVQGPIYRNLYAHSTGRTKQKAERLTEPLVDGLHSLYQEYVKEFQLWHNNGTDTPPVFIIVANDIPNAQAIFDYVSGYENSTDYPWQPGRLELLTNVDLETKKLSLPPRTILIHSRLESDKEVSKSLTTYLKHQSELYRQAYPDYDWADDDKTVMRTVLNTVGKKGEPGEQVRCVVSVSMLTEGWDARTVKYALGFRRFGTQLLCEQVAGRSLRRAAYDNFDEETQRFPAEYADIFGIPFTFAFERPVGPPPPPPLPTYEVKPLPERGHYRIHWPNVTGYRLEPVEYDLLTIDWDPFERYLIRPMGPSETEMEDITGNTTLISTERERNNTAIYHIAQRLTDILQGKANSGTDGCDPEVPLRRAEVFKWSVARLREGIRLERIQIQSGALWPAAQDPQLEELCQQLAQCARLGSSQTKPRTIASGDPPWFFSTAGINAYWSSRPDKVITHKSHLNIAPCGNQWEARVARALDEHTKVIKWARNDRQRWQIPYLYEGQWSHYEPDFVAEIWRGEDKAPLNVVIEVKGREWPSDPDKRKYAREYWIPAINDDATYSQHGPWEYLYVEDPGEATMQIDLLAGSYQT